MTVLKRCGLLIAGLATTGCGQDKSMDVLPAGRSVTVSSSADQHRLSGDQNRTGGEALDGRQVDPFANPGAKAVVLIFVSTDCPIANRYAPTIQELYERYRSQPVGFWLVFADGSESRQKIQEHLAAYGHEAPALRDPQHRLVEFCGATKTPEAVVFAARRKLAYRGRIDDLFTDFGKWREQPTKHDLSDAIEAVLEGRAADPAQSAVIGCDIPGAKP